MDRPFALVLLLLAPAAFATELNVPFHTGVALQSALVSSDQAEMRLQPNALLAENGLRRASVPGEQFYPFASLVLGEQYVVRGAHLVEYLVTVKKLGRDSA